MSEWRRQAMASFPDRIGILNKATSIHDLWFRLYEDLRGAYRQVPPDQDLIDRIWHYAGWSFEGARHPQVRNAVAVSFYEHVPHFGPARREMPFRLSRRSFDDLLPAFRVSLTEPELRAFVQEFLGAQGVPAKEIGLVLLTAS